MCTINATKSPLTPSLWIKLLPKLTNLMELQMRIIERAEEFKIYGDIELDEGHSFTY